MRRLALAIPFLLSFALAEAAEPARTAERPETTVINADELNTKYEVRGPLGVPLGEIVTVRGQTVRNLRKSPGNLFQVNAVNGRPLRQPVTMWYVFMGELAFGKEYELRAYQTGKFQGDYSIPKQDPEREQATAQTVPFGFVTSLVVFERLKPDEPSRQQRARKAPNAPR